MLRREAQVLETKNGPVGLRWWKSEEVWGQNLSVVTKHLTKDVDAYYGGQHSEEGDAKKVF